MTMFRSPATLFILSASGVAAHSWLACVDYQCTAAAPAAAATCECKGYPRNWANTMQGATFSTDRGRDNRPGLSPAAGGLVCNDKEPNPGAGPVTAYYSNQFPMASLQQGQTVRWRWPAKNHATVGIQRGVQVYISSAANQGDVFPAAATAADIYAEMDFSKCDPRQGGVDNADCQDEFTIKTSTPPGRYTLMWWWEFNAGEFYNTCADVTITAAVPGAPGQQPGQPGTPSTPGTPTNPISSQAPPQTCLGMMVGECQTDLDMHKTAAAAMTPPLDVAYCSEEGRKLANTYGQVAEIRKNIDLAPLQAIGSCAELFSRMEGLCTQMSSVATKLSFGKDPDAGYTFGNVFLGFVLGVAGGMAFYRFGLPRLQKKLKPAPCGGNVQMSAAGAPPPPTTFKQASAYKNLGAGAPPPPPPGPPPPGPPPYGAQC